MLQKQSRDDQSMCWDSAPATNTLCAQCWDGLWAVYHGFMATGADIIMALDDVVPATAKDPQRFEEATHRTTRWIDRCIKAHSRPTEQNLFGIVQVGVDSLILVILKHRFCSILGELPSQAKQLLSC